MVSSLEKLAPGGTRSIESTMCAERSGPDQFRVSVIIPTKNRPDALGLTVQTVVAQSVLPASIVIVDQSADDASRRRVDDEMRAASLTGRPLPDLRYIHDPGIAGGAAARNRGMGAATGDILLFLDDDVALERGFIAQLLAVYRDHPEATGVGGIITNYPRPATASRFWAEVFMRGPFRDERQRVYWDADRLRGAAPIRVRGFTGAAMSFRAQVIGGQRLDENLGNVWYVDDVDFCFRLGPGRMFLIAPGARLQHLRSPVGRITSHWLRRHAHSNLFLYRRHWGNGVFNRISHAWLLAGYCAAATFASARRLSLEPWRALLLGAREASQAAASH